MQPNHFIFFWHCAIEQYYRYCTILLPCNSDEKKIEKKMPNKSYLQTGLVQMLALAQRSCYIHHITGSSFLLPKPYNCHSISLNQKKTLQHFLGDQLRNSYHASLTAMAIVRNAIYKLKHFQFPNSIILSEVPNIREST